ncbi:MAG: RagB/SusD family nutrient uptake outer membrane protein [Prevotellaceae bacterium]|jgi:hypothetical protein|nr:RagB/SusD family nutrient uptake outer membrane protein [Prevotellaceae bacterium]
MKSIKLYALLLPALPALAGCTKWLDGAQPVDQNLDKTQYASEAGVNSVLNGFYRTLSSEKLYGSVMTITALELLAHYYYYEENLSSNGDFTYFNYMSRYQYQEGAVKNPFSGVWSEAYSAIFRINSFISAVSASGVLRESKQRMALGEAYGLRAFLHLDLFRLFGSKAQGIPYNLSAEVIPHEVQAPEAFFALLLQDIEQAKELLRDDPIITDGVLDLTQVKPTDNVTEKEIFDRYLRSYRMNYYAVLALQARALMFKGDVQAAALAAQSVIDNAFGDGKPFRWADKRRIDADYNYILYSEVIFGVYNFDLYATWEKYIYGTRPGQTYTVSASNLLNNIFRFDNTGGAMSLWEDVRVRQWQPSKAGTGLYISNKLGQFTRANENDPIQYYQPLMRMSEMFYIVIENRLLTGNTSGAISLLNEVRFNRGSQWESLPDPAGVTVDVAFEMLEAEYYKEFYGEGQVFFYLKRRESSTVFNPNGKERDNVTAEDYVIPIPEGEKNI